MTHKMALILILLGFCTSLAPAQAAPATVENLRCELRAEPLGIDTAQPRLSWQIRSDIRGQSQAACQILAASSPEILARGQGDLWDSGKLASGQSIHVPYAGKPLSSLQQVHWKVRVWPARPASAPPSDWSQPSTWTMGLLQPADWQARWITLEGLESIGKDARGRALPPPLPCLRKAFTVDKPLKRAVVCVCGLGQYELSLNGRRVGDAVLDPGWTDYKKSCLYSTYDVTADLKPGRNALGVLLGNGMYNVAGGRYTKFTGSYGPPKLILQLRLEFADGTAQTLASDATWKGAASPVRFSCIYGGEDYDARQETPGWDTAAFDDTAWRAATVTEGPGGRLTAEAQPPVKVMEEFKTVKVTQPRPGITVYDLGRNFSGWPALAVQGPAGASVKLTPGELLDRNGLVTQRSSGGPTYFTYTLKGAGEETWHPRFSYYGFRYLQVESRSADGATSGAGLPRVLTVGGQFVHSSAATVGQFACSNPLVNQIHALINAAIQSNLQSVLTDCPHREKLGWLEQSHLLGRAVMFNYDLPNFYAKICRDMAQAQLESGMVPDIAPEYVAFQGGFRDSPEWGSAFIIDPWLVYQAYGDRRPLEEHYAAMAKYVDYLGSKARDGIISYGLGDWYDIGPKGPGVSQLTSLGVTGTAVYYQDLAVMKQAAEALGRVDDSKKYYAMAMQTREAFNRAFFHPGTNDYDRGSQTAAAMALTLGMPPNDKQAAVMKTLVDRIRAGGNRVTAGDVGFHYLVEALADGGRDAGQVLYDITTQDAGPGYAMQLKKGATTLTEAWDTNAASSQNHCMLGHAEEWLYTGLGGITPMAPAFREVWIKPVAVKGLGWVEVSYDSVFGRIRSAWKRQGGGLRMEVEIPVGATARVSVPAKGAESVREGDRPAAQAEGVRFLTMDDGAADFAVAAGHYVFEARE